MNTAKEPVTLHNIGFDGCQIVKAKILETEREPRYQFSGFYDQENEVMVMRGGAWRADPARVGYGFTKQDVEDVRKQLRAIGVTASFDEVDSMLCHGQYVLDARRRRERANPAA